MDPWKPEPSRAELDAEFAEEEAMMKQCEFCRIPTTRTERVKLEDGRTVTVVACKDRNDCDARAAAVSAIIWAEY